MPIHGSRCDDLMPCISNEESYSVSYLELVREYILHLMLGA